MTLLFIGWFAWHKDTVRVIKTNTEMRFSDQTWNGWNDVVDIITDSGADRSAAARPHLWPGGSQRGNNATATICPPTALWVECRDMSPRSLETIRWWGHNGSTFCGSSPTGLLDVSFANIFTEETELWHWKLAFSRAEYFPKYTGTSR